MFREVWITMNNLKISRERQWEEQTVQLPAGYPAYCIYVPTGMNEEYEKNILAKLQVWGESMGKNLYVAPWNIGDPSYIKLMKKIGFERRPAIILADKNSFMLVLDDPLIVRKASELTEILPSLLDFILKDEFMVAAKAAVKAGKIAKLKSLSKNIESILSKVKVTFSLKGVTLESK
jgi:hypothetical protein